jgi:hypothetical protein
MKESKLKASIFVLFATSVLTAAVAHAQTYSQLNDLPGGMQGAPMMVSNNPEAVNRAGLLLGMDPMTSTNAGRATRNLTTGVIDSGCPSGGMKQFSFYMHHLLQAPASAGDAQVDRIYLILEPVGGSATFSAFGVAISQRDIIEDPNNLPPANESYTLDPGRSPSYSVSKALVTGALPNWVGSTNGSKIISYPASPITSQRTITQPTEIFLLKGGSTPLNASMDARITFNASSGCLRARVVAAPNTITTATAANDLGKSLYAWGNVATTYKPDNTVNISGGTPCSSRQSQNLDGTYNWTGWGRPAGIYQFNKWVGTVPVSLSSNNQTVGYRYLAAPSNLIKSTNITTTPGGVCDPTSTPFALSSDAQRAPALRYYDGNTSGTTGGVLGQFANSRDSDKFSTSNYGVEYMMTYNVTNTSTSCMKAQLIFTAYPATQQCALYSAGAATRHYDGEFKITQGVATAVIKKAYIKCNTSVKTTPYIPAERVTEAVLAEQVLGIASTNKTVTWTAQNFIPGLISLPGAMLVRSVPSTCP